MYYTACLLLTIQWQLLCQAIVSLVYKWEGLLKIFWGGCNPSNPPRSAPASGWLRGHVPLVPPASATYTLVSAHDLSHILALSDTLN